MPDIRYVFSVDGVEYRGKRISIGEIPPDSPGVEAALELYQVGRTGPVYYNPDNPEEAVLERDPPVSPRTMYAIAAGVMLVGFVVVGTFSGLGEIVQWLQPHFPPGAFIPGFLFFLACGLFAGVMMIASLATAQLAARWPTTPGTVITSQVESRREPTGGGASRTMVVWSPLVEYVYRVGTREYHGTRIGFGPTVSAGRDLAEAVIARYPEKATVTVHYHPANPSQATLETHVAHGWVGLCCSSWFPLPLRCSFRVGSSLAGRTEGPLRVEQALRHLAQLGALDLEAVGGGRLGEVVDREDAHRHLVVGEPVLAVGDRRRLVERRAGLQHHEGDGAHALGPRHGDGLAAVDAPAASGCASRSPAD